MLKRATFGGLVGTRAFGFVGPGRFVDKMFRDIKLGSEVTGGDKTITR